MLSLTIICYFVGRCILFWLVLFFTPGIGTQGGDRDSWVTLYTLEYSEEGESWLPYKEEGETKVTPTLYIQRLLLQALNKTL
jgi:hypothetical protein